MNMEKDPKKCGSSFNLGGVVMCKKLCAPCAIVYPRRVVCAVEQGEMLLKAFGKLINDSKDEEVIE